MLPVVRRTSWYTLPPIPHHRRGAFLSGPGSLPLCHSAIPLPPMPPALCTLSCARSENATHRSIAARLAAGHHVLLCVGSSAISSALGVVFAVASAPAGAGGLLRRLTISWSVAEPSAGLLEAVTRALHSYPGLQSVKVNVSTHVPTSTSGDHGNTASEACSGTPCGANESKQASWLFASPESAAGNVAVSIDADAASHGNAGGAATPAWPWLRPPGGRASWLPFAARTLLLFVAIGASCSLYVAGANFCVMHGDWQVGGLIGVLHQMQHSHRVPCT
jgi:hypothetical protein